MLYAIRYQYKGFQHTTLADFDSFEKALDHANSCVGLEAPMGGRLMKILAAYAYDLSEMMPFEGFKREWEGLTSSPSQKASTNC